MKSKSEPSARQPSTTAKKATVDWWTELGVGPLPIELTKMFERIPDDELGRIVIKATCRMIREINPPFLNCGGGRWSVPLGILFRSTPHFRQGPLKLTARQAVIAYGVAIGLSNKQIASELKISEQTVKDHVSLLMRKAKLEPGDASRVRLAIWYLGIGSL